jgi:hypothetical protein
MWKTHSNGRLPMIEMVTVIERARSKYGLYICMGENGMKCALTIVRKLDDSMKKTYTNHEVSALF